MENLMHSKVYVGTYAKYNNGSIKGQWIELSNFSSLDEFYEFCAELHSDETDPEFMFQDWENIPSELISESSLSENIFSIIEKVSDLEYNTLEAFSAWISIGNHNIASDDIDSLYEGFEDDYLGDYNSEEDFAYQIAEECYDLSDFAKTYFDYESFARDLFMGDYTYESGHVFRNN
ncbi:antirestriction protein ArdA [Myroides odoratimimus]|uniref:antirestriction protein ArdA n=1 Tax=Myroides odoratimimus TaxID=76832 RepID=UPI002DBC47EF|nr:antirestriction protein ArdA [Myroides odoratimimus]MEC4094988.1 antirestriction protein ArdA [Myroides odoratimimus]